MIEDKYLKWSPLTPLPRNPYIEFLHYEGGVFKIFLKEDGYYTDKVILFTFDRCLAYRATEESGRLKSLGNLSLQTFNQLIHNSFHGLEKRA